MSPPATIAESPEPDSANVKAPPATRLPALAGPAAAGMEAALTRARG